MAGRNFRRGSHLLLIGILMTTVWVPPTEEQLIRNDVLLEIFCTDIYEHPRFADSDSEVFILSSSKENTAMENDVYFCKITADNRRGGTKKNAVPEVRVSFLKTEIKNRKGLETERVPPEAVIPFGGKTLGAVAVCVQTENPHTNMKGNVRSRKINKLIQESRKKRTIAACDAAFEHSFTEMQEKNTTFNPAAYRRSKKGNFLYHFNLNIICITKQKNSVNSKLEILPKNIKNLVERSREKGLRKDTYFTLFGSSKLARILCEISTSIFSKNKIRRKRTTGMAPEMMYSFIEQAVQPGGHISLKCSATGDPLPRFDWMLDNDFLSISTHRIAVGQFIDHSGFVISHLNITGVRVEDGGLYECKASNSKGYTSHSARLNVYGPPYIRSMITKRGVTGGDITILCPYYGYPISHVKWETNGLDILSDPRYQQDGGYLKISGLNPSRDAGTLTCSVGSPGGELARRDLQLLINSPPVLSPLMFPPTLNSGQRAQLSCTVISGDMPVYFTWLKDGGPISASMQIEERSSEFFSLLIIKSLSAIHSGSYTCISTNSAGKVNISEELIIKVPPYWKSEPQDVSLLLGSPLSISCDAKGHPEPKRFWSKQRAKDGKDYGVVSSVNGHLHTFNNGTLLIDSVNKQDEGIYRCTAENGIGAILYKNILIDVNEPARFETDSQNITVKRNEPVTLVCDILGDSPIRNTWTLNTMDIHSNYRIKITESKKESGLKSEMSIDRADRQDSGLYRCHASNSYGRSEHFIYLSVQERPDPPRQVELMQVDSRSVKLKWKKPFNGNSPILGYQLQYQVLAQNARETWSTANVLNITLTNSTTPTSAISENYEHGSVNGLLPDSTYSMRMMAFNQIDSSIYSDVLVVKTQEEAPSEPPQNIKVHSGEAGELIVTWQAPRFGSWHGTLLGYTIHWTEVETGVPSALSPHTSSTFVKGSSTNKFSITGLGQYAKYRVTVSANNRAGNGPPSVPILTSTKEGVPSSPPQSVRCTPLSSQSLKIEWTSPPRSHHGGNLLGYKILYKPLTDIYMEDNVSSAEVKRTSSSETYLHALLKYTNYSIQVLAYTGAGDGILSPAVFCTTEEDIPGQPANLKAISLNADSILVSWLAPKKPNGKIVFYTLYYRAVGSDDAPTTRQVSVADALSPNKPGLGGTVEVRGLVEKGRYEFWLSASTGAGEGSATSPVIETSVTKSGARIASFGGLVRSGAGRPLTLGCTAAGNPTPRTNWAHSRKTISHGHQYRVTGEGNLLIHSVDESVSGNYTCTAKNLFGSDEITYSVVCLLPPGPPTIQLLYTTASSAQLQWSPNLSDGGSPILGYTLSYKRADENMQVMELSPEVTSYKIESLKCGSRYAFQIASFNRVGKGEFSLPLHTSTKGEAPKFSKDWSSLTWSNATSIVVDVQRALSGNGGSLCPLLALGAEWRRDETGGTVTWNAVSIHNKGPLVISPLTPANWYQIRIAAENHAGKGETVIRAATTTFSGALLSSTANIPVPVIPNDLDGSHDNIFNLISITLATLAAISTLSVLYLLVAKRSVICNCSDQSVYGGDRQRSQSQASDEKTICADQQNTRNCQHDYSTSPIKGPPEKMRNTEGYLDMYEISPYATFQVGVPPRTPSGPILDHTLQFRTFGHMDNDASPSPCKRHYPQKTHRYTRSKGEDDIENGCELLQPIRMKGRPRQGSGPSYCVPMAGQGEGFQAVLQINKSDVC